jgi:hypothetical protein
MAGPAIRNCPGCGAEIGRDQFFSEDLGKLFVLPLPRTCPECDTFLVTQPHSISKHQTILSGCP